MSKIISLEDRAKVANNHTNNLLKLVNSSNSRFALIELKYLRDSKHIGEESYRRVWGVVKDNYSGITFDIGVYATKKTPDYYVTVHTNVNKGLVNKFKTLVGWTILNEKSGPYYRIGSNGKNYNLNTFDAAVDRMKQMALDLLTA